jgi:hypothetical protein
VLQYCSFTLLANQGFSLGILDIFILTRLKQGGLGVKLEIDLLVLNFNLTHHQVHWAPVLLMEGQVITFRWVRLKSLKRLTFLFQFLRLTATAIFGRLVLLRPLPSNFGLGLATLGFAIEGSVDDSLVDLRSHSCHLLTC